MPLPTAIQQIREFGGIDNRNADTDIPAECFTDAQNIDFSVPKRCDVRLGYDTFNSAVISASPAIQSLHTYVGSGANSLFVSCNDGTVRKSQGAGGSFTDSTSGLTTNNNAYPNTVQFGGRRVSSTSYAGRMFYVNGVDENKTYSEADGWQKMGITAPSTIPTLAELYGQGSAAMASGSYYVKCVYYNSAKGLESNPNAASLALSLTASAAGISLTNIPQATDSQVSHKRLYRTMAGGTTYYFLSTLLNSATVYTATAADASLGDALETDNNVPPVMKYLEEYQSCLFGAGDTTDSVTKSLLYYSKQLDDSPESWPSSYYLSITPDDGDQITMVKKVGNRLIVAKKNSWGVVIGDGPTTFRYTVIDNSHGCIAPNSAALTENAVIFLSSDGFRICDGTRSLLLCEKTMKFSEMSFNSEQLAKFYGRYFRRKQQYICGVVTGSNTAINKAVKIQFPAQQWSWDSYTFNSIHQYFNDDGDESLYIGTNAGQVYDMFNDGRYTDNGTAISWYFTFGPIYCGRPDVVKKFHTCTINADNSSSPTGAYLDSVDGGTPADAKSLSFSSRFTRTGIDKTGRFAQIKMSGSTSTYVRFHDFEIKAGMERLRRF